MKCISCEAAINPTWTWAIKNNVCSVCGGPILNDLSKELMEDLENALSQMKDITSREISIWLMEHYELTLKSTGEPVNFHRKPEQPQYSPQLKPETRVKNTGLGFDKNPKADYRAIAAQINQGMIGGVQPLTEDALDAATSAVSMKNAGISGEQPDPLDAVIGQYQNGPTLIIPEVGVKPLGQEDLASLVQSVGSIQGTGAISGQGIHASEEMIAAERRAKLEKQEASLRGYTNKQSGFRRA